MKWIRNTNLWARSKWRVKSTTQVPISKSKSPSLNNRANLNYSWIIFCIGETFFSRSLEHPSSLCRIIATELIKKGGPLVFFFAYFLVLFCIIFSTKQILQLADERKFKDFEFEKLGNILVGPKFGVFIEILLFLSQISVFIAGILFSGSFISRFHPLHILF